MSIPVETHCQRYATLYHAEYIPPGRNRLYRRTPGIGSCNVMHTIPKWRETSQYTIRCLGGRLQEHDSLSRGLAPTAARLYIACLNISFRSTSQSATAHCGECHGFVAITISCLKLRNLSRRTDSSMLPCCCPRALVRSLSAVSFVGHSGLKDSLIWGTPRHIATTSSICFFTSLKSGSAVWPSVHWRASPMVVLRKIASKGRLLRRSSASSSRASLDYGCLCTFSLTGSQNISMKLSSIVLPSFSNVGHLSRMLFQVLEIVAGSLSQWFPIYEIWSATRSFHPWSPSGS